MTAGYQPDLTSLWFKEGQSVSWHQTQTLGATDTVSVCLNTLHWYISYNLRGRCGTGNRIKGWQGNAGKWPREARIFYLQDWINSPRVKQRQDGDGDASETAPYLSVCPHHLSSVMALPHRPRVLSPTRYSFWRSAPGSWILAAASASQPWDKSLQQISVMDGFQKRCEERDLPNVDNKLLINESLWP